MSWHSTARWPIDARGFTQPLTTPMDLEYSNLNRNMRNSPSWWSPQRLSQLEQPDNVSPGLIRGTSLRQLDLPSKPSFGIPAGAAGHTGMLRGNFQGVQMGLRTEGRKFEPLRTPAAMVATPSHFARFPSMTAPKTCRAPAAAQSTFMLPWRAYSSPPRCAAACAARRFLLVEGPSLSAGQGLLSVTMRGMCVRKTAK